MPPQPRTRTANFDPSGSHGRELASPPFAADVIDLADRLAGRLGAERVRRLQQTSRRLPEMAVSLHPLAALTPPRSSQSLPVLAPSVRHARPLRLLARPEAVDAVAVLPDRPPVMFRWRGQSLRVRIADGPERIVPEWWIGHGEGGTASDAGVRDYYRVETVDGSRYWVFRQTSAPMRAVNGAVETLALHAAADPGRWFLHGVFA